MDIDPNRWLAMMMVMMMKVKKKINFFYRSKCFNWFDWYFFSIHSNESINFFRPTFFCSISWNCGFVKNVKLPSRYLHKKNKMVVLLCVMKKKSIDLEFNSFMLDNKITRIIVDSHIAMMKSLYFTVIISNHKFHSFILID